MFLPTTFLSSLVMLTGGFRDYIASGRRFAVNEICEFTATKVFEGIGTS